MKKLKKVLLPLLLIGVFVALSYLLLQFAGAFFLGYSWAKQAETAEREIRQYVETVDVYDLIEESQRLMEEAKKEGKVYWTLSGETIPKKWQEREVSIIAYNQDHVDYTWTGGVLDRRGIMVTKENGNLRIVAQISPEEPSIILYP